MEDEFGDDAQAFLNATGDVPETLNAAAQPGATMANAPQQAIEPTFVLTVEMMQQAVEFPFAMAAMMAGKGGEFWGLKPLESKSLAQAWLPVFEKLLAMWGASSMGGLIMAGMMTGASLVPRLYLERARRASPTVTTGTEKSGDLPQSSAPREAESLANPIDSLEAAFAS